MVTEVPSGEIIELNGSVSKTSRVQQYEKGRVFFMTPQTMQYDIESGIIDCSKIVCLVIDEAHRASGNYAYCNVIEALEHMNIGFRILSLSATPISKIENL